MKIGVTIAGGDKAIRQFEKTKDDIQAALRDGVQRAALRLVVRSKQKLSDDVLKVRTGRLRRSITSRITEQPGRVEGIVGTVVSYARPHEFGFSGAVNVREHLRKAKAGKQFVVHAHSRKVCLPERSFLRSSLRELGSEINEAFAAALKDKFQR